VHTVVDGKRIIVPSGPLMVPERRGSEEWMRSTGCALVSSIQTMGFNTH